MSTPPVPNLGIARTQVCPNLLSYRHRESDPIRLNQSLKRVRKSRCFQRTNFSRSSIGTVLLGCAWGLSSQAHPLLAKQAISLVWRLAERPAAHPDRLVASKTLTGRFSTFVWGDYLYAKVRAETGEELLFRIERNENCFLAEHRAAQLAIAYKVVERFIPQSGKYHSVNLIQGIKTEQADLATWERSITTEKLEQCREATK